MKAQREGINELAKPSGTGCVECLATGTWWFHLRRRTQCGNIGAVIVRQISMHRNIMRLQVTRSLRVSSQESGGSTIIVQVNFSQARLSPLLIRIR